MSKKSPFRGWFDKQDHKRAKTLFQFGSQHLDENHSSLARKLCSENSLLLTCQILVMLVNTLVANEKYPVLNRDNLTIPIKMQLSQKQKTSSQFLAAFLKSRLNFEYFEQKDDPHRFCISKITDSENVVR